MGIFTERFLNTILSNDPNFRDTVWDGVVLTLGTLAVTLAFEFLSLDTVKRVWKQPQGTELYWRAWVYNVINHGLIGFPVYIVAAVFFCTEKEEPPSSAGGDMTTSEESRMTSLLSLSYQVIWILAWHSIQYYAAHKAFHEYPTLYRTFHRFHHRFNTYTPPSAANAVTPGEYFLAYILPFLLPLLLLPIAPLSMKVATSIISFLNILVHTPRLEELSRRMVPTFWVSTHNHLDHHRKLTSHYASPTFNIDNILESRWWWN